MSSALGKFANCGRLTSTDLFLTRDEEPLYKIHIVEDPFTTNGRFQIRHIPTDEVALECLPGSAFLDYNEAVSIFQPLATGLPNATCTRMAQGIYNIVFDALEDDFYQFLVTIHEPHGYLGLTAVTFGKISQ